MFTRAMATFAVARGLNGVVSMLQGTEIALQPAGVGLTLTVGELLDPLNDLVERFSWVMLAATAALGMQAVLMDAVADALLTGALVIAGFALLARIWWRPLASRDSGGWIIRAFVLLAFLRLALPVTALAAESFSEAWLEPRRVAATATLLQTRERLDEVEPAGTAPPASPEAAAEAPSVFDRLRGAVQQGRESLDLTERLAALGEEVERASRAVIELIVVFLLQTVLLPLGALWALWKLTLHLLSRRPP